MAKRAVRVLAVADPAVRAYVEPGLGILDAWAARGEEPAAFDIVPWAEYSSLLERECSSRSPEYDVVMIAGHLWLRDYAERGALASLGARIAALGPEYGDEDVLPEIRRETSWAGERWLLPSFTDGHLVFADSEALSALFPGSVPELLSTQELERAARRLAGAGGSPRFGLKAHPSEIFLDWLPYALDEGVEPFDGDGLPTFNVPEGVGALSRYVGMRALSLGGCELAGNEEILEALRSRKALMAVSWGGQAGRIAHGDRGFGYLGLTRPWNVTWSFGLLARSSAADDAFRFLAYLTGAPVDRAVGRYAGSPTRASSYADEESRALCPWYGAQESLVGRAYALPSFPGAGAALGILYEELASAFAGRSSPADALGRAEKRVLEARKAR
ncbi:MAG: extracellular solute-binding protein [Spirochaetes bacterium]|nr:extracellular solute-binding protein [Spirochaetota bacterium]